jgi:predicted nucleotidyltransferase
MQRQDIVKNLSEIIHREAPQAKVILYGSEARGDAGPKSDIDLLILLDKDKVTLEDEEKITYPIYLLELKTGILISPMVVARKIWENRPFKTPFYINVMNEGVEI